MKLINICSHFSISPFFISLCLYDYFSLLTAFGFYFHVCGYNVEDPADNKEIKLYYVNCPLVACY